MTEVVQQVKFTKLFYVDAFLTKYFANYNSTKQTITSILKEII